jgi:multiple sugar transport system substrate-binding protein
MKKLLKPEIIERLYKKSNSNLNQEERFFYKIKLDLYLFMQYVKEVRGYFHEPVFGNPGDDVIAGIRADYNGNVPFSMAHNTYAINSNSKNKRLAWEFIKFMSGEEVQSLLMPMGAISINRNALEASKKEFFSMTGYAVFPENYTIDVTAIDYSATVIAYGAIDYDAYMAQLNEFADKINTQTIHDTAIDQFIDEEVTAYFDGKKSAKEAAQAIQNKANLYLSE